MAGIAALGVAIAAGGLFFGVGALSAQSEADRVYAQHHPVGETQETRAAAELKMKQEAAAEEEKREEANARSGQDPEAAYTPPPQPQVAANRAMPPGAADPASPARSTTALFADSFAKDLLMARAMVSGSAAQPVAATLVPNSCMESWVREHVHDFDGKSTFGVTTLCGRQVALIAGAGGIDEKILLFGSAQKDGPQDVRQLLLASTGTDVSFASASTEDGRTAVMIAAVAP
ncbi:hypothetical protein [Leifsonia sp. TF02-11]|uniref:hypothetical protein n=1 Tax=Leifsonia sp. TF02-11 TaxID=2815212 RepID=UPI001AA1D2B4|nr:hypothetical protein [Leifsonia sp. TF02-11]MBO1741037.1 hypothetical protein [Leifsonia sp. TF02-11]